MALPLLPTLGLGIAITGAACLAGSELAAAIEVDVCSDDGIESCELTMTSDGMLQVIPALTAPILEDSLTSNAVVQPGRCGTGRNGGELVGEGLLLKIRGRCDEWSTSAELHAEARGLTVPDGELRAEARLVSGIDHGYFNLYVRGTEQGLGGYVATFYPSVDRVTLSRRESNEIPSAVLAEKSHAELLLHGENSWISVAVRLRGSTIWVLVNGKPVLEVDDPHYTSGNVGLGAGRIGDVTEVVESAAVFRGLVASGLAEGSMERRPTYQAIAPKGMEERRPGEIRRLSGDILNDIQSCWHQGSLDRSADEAAKVPLVQSVRSSGRDEGVDEAVYGKCTAEYMRGYRRMPMTPYSN